VGRARILIASCLWVAASLTPAWAAGPDEEPAGGFFIKGAFTQPYPFFLTENPDSVPHLNLKGLRLAPLQTSSSTVLPATSPGPQGVNARYETGLGNYRFELSGSYLPGMRSSISTEFPLDSQAYLSSVNLTIPLSQFYLKGGAFWGQNVEALGLILGRPSEEQGVRKGDLFGYQIGGGYRFSDSLSLQAGWGQAAQEYEMIRQGLGAWYVQAQIGLGWRMSLTSEVGAIDISTGDREQAGKDAFYLGARWEIRF